MMGRAAAQTVASLVVMGAALFIAAGDWRWLPGWLFLAEIGVASMAVSAWLARHDPALLASRLSGPVERGQQRWDRVFFAVAMVMFLAWLALCGLDARRFGWSVVPVWVQVCGAVLVALSIAVSWQTFRFNTFAAPQVRVQADRKHHVITDGPYRIVRHPMYAGALLMFVGAPLMLGSWWGLLFVPVGAAGIGARAVGEERMLRRDLEGYDAYAARVRFRLVPGVW